MITTINSYHPVLSFDVWLFGVLTLWLTVNLTFIIFTGAPIIVTHPTDMVTNVSESVTLNCKGIGGGSITYQWETSDVSKDQWMEIRGDSDGEKLAIRNVEKSEKYRCIASNEAGSTISNASTVTLLGK